MSHRAALKRLEKPVEYRLHKGEGHVITQRPNVRDFWQRRFAFADNLNPTNEEKGGVTFDGDRARARPVHRWPFRPIPN